jgi:hypothetical protein
VLIGMSERVAGLARDPAAPALERVLSWLQPADDLRPMWRHEAVARARVLAAREAWIEAIRTLDGALARDPQMVSVLKLRAEILSWSGQSSAAIAGYDAYLTAAPQDLQARRQQARVASWAGWSREAGARYR